MNIMKYYRISIIIISLTILHIIINLFIYWQYSSTIYTKRRLSSILIQSGIIINSFNPSLINFILNSEITQSNTISIIDNNSIFVQLIKSTKTSTMKMTLPDGYHHLDIIIIDEIQNIEFYQEIEISTGSKSFIITILDQQYKSVENISVHLELVDYSHITLEDYTNHLGEVTFHYLPKHAQVYIEAICTKSKRYAFVEIDTLHYHNITLILKDMSTLYNDEYGPFDRGYYAA